MRRSRVVWGPHLGAQMNLYLNYHRSCGFATEPFHGESSSAQKDDDDYLFRQVKSKPKPKTNLAASGGPPVGSATEPKSNQKGDLSGGGGVAPPPSSLFY